jgi:redox-sensitive bicupin YhaK (pirin superfamily)
MRKQIKYILPAQLVDMGGIPLKQAIPTEKVGHFDPFLLLHHAVMQSYSDRPARTQGIGPHPHRGFSPVTFVINGEVHHRDSFGNNQVAKAGDVQWLNAGAGIIHSERPSEELAQADGQQEIIQLWINTPSLNKMDIPSYYHLTESEMPLFTSKDSKIRSRLIAGDYRGEKTKIKNDFPMTILWGVGQKGGSDVYTIRQEFATAIYLINGEVSLKGFGLVEAESLVIFEEGGTEIDVIIKEDSQFLILSAQAIKEKIEQHGPFVMNNQTQILEAMRDYQMGKMGILIEED